MKEIRERLHYLDVAKGLLMLLVIIHHTFIYNNESLKDCDIDLIMPIQNFWVSFFMPAFFVITGYCTNFNRKFGDYVWRNFKSIMIPAWFFTIFSLMKLPQIDIADAARSILLYGSGWWFLSALFFSKIVYWFLLHYLKKNILLATLVILSFLSTVFNEMNSQINYFYYKEILNLTLFLWIGSECKSFMNKRSVGIISTAVFVVVTLLSIKLFGKVPSVTFGFNCTMAQYPLYLLLSVTGSIFFIHLCKLINKNASIEYFGRGSLLIFVTHFYFVVTMLNLMKESLLAHGFVGSMMLMVSSVVMVCLFTSFIIWLFNHKYLNWVLGKF